MGVQVKTKAKADLVGPHHAHGLALERDQSANPKATAVSLVFQVNQGHDQDRGQYQTEDVPRFERVIMEEIIQIITGVVDPTVQAHPDLDPAQDQGRGHLTRNQARGQKAPRRNQ